MKPLPCGPLTFTSLVGIVAPYSSSIGATIKELSPSKCVASMPQRCFVLSLLNVSDGRPWLGNPYNSTHALALANLAFVFLLIVAPISQRTRIRYGSNSQDAGSVDRSRHRTWYPGEDQYGILQEGTWSDHSHVHTGWVSVSAWCLQERHCQFVRSVTCLMSRLLLTCTMVPEKKSQHSQPTGT
jgi:hypothetical protein